jgi:hypothetical protein
MIISKQNLASWLLNIFFCASVSAYSAGGDGNHRLPKILSSAAASQFSWTQVSDGAAFLGAYNFPVFTVRQEAWAFHPQGNWSSTDGRAWTRSELPLAGLQTGYQKYVQMGDAVYALGTMEGNYTNMRLSSRIARTSDFKRWEVLAEHSELPARVFYGAVVFNNKIWLMGGFDGHDYYNDVWNSADAVHWTRINEHVAWSPRNAGACVVFKDRIWMIGGGVIDGTKPVNANEGREIWSSIDGINWAQASDTMARTWGGSPVVFNGKLWLVGANRDGNFSRAVMVTDDGIKWRDETAPWSPRGAVATWIFDDRLYMTGGKYSVAENGEIKFIYSNDVWYMAAS